MELEEAKKEVSEIIRKVIHGEEVYYLDGKFVRWGRVEKDLHAVLERLLTQRAADGLESEPKCYCPADGLYPGCPVHGNHRR